MHTTISLTHLPMRRMTCSGTRGGGLASPGRRLHPTRILGVRPTAPFPLPFPVPASSFLLVPDPDPDADPDPAERSTLGRRTFIDRERETVVIVLDEDVRRVKRVGDPCAPSPFNPAELALRSSERKSEPVGVRSRSRSPSWSSGSSVTGLGHKFFPSSLFGVGLLGGTATSRYRDGPAPDASIVES